LIFNERKNNISDDVVQLTWRAMCELSYEQ
jgi:hypothetical protein